MADRTPLRADAPEEMAQKAHLTKWAGEGMLQAAREVASSAEGRHREVAGSGLPDALQPASHS
jgi:hypothetical protein